MLCNVYCASMYDRYVFVPALVGILPLKYEQQQLFLFSF